MNILNEGDLKTLAKGLRRELNSIGIELTHTQVLEMIARGAGYASLAALQVLIQPSAPSESPKLAPTYRLLNTKGELDLHEVDGDDDRRRLVTGLWWLDVEQTSEIVRSSSSVSAAMRHSDGSLEVVYDGNNDVDWDSQKQELNSRGVGIWLADGDPVAEDHCFLLPRDAGDEGVALTVRKLLVDTVLRYLRDRRLTNKALEEIVKLRADEICRESSLESAFFPVLAAAQQAVGFAMHDGEIDALQELLTAA